LYFIHLTYNKLSKKFDSRIPRYDINLLKEVYFKDKNVSKFLEYAPGKYAVCIYKDDNVYLLNRQNHLIEKIRKPGGKSCCYELCLCPFS